MIGCLKVLVKHYFVKLGSTGISKLSGYFQNETGWLVPPTLEHKAILLAKVQDEAGHGVYIYSAVKTLGKSSDEMTKELFEKEFPTN